MTRAARGAVPFAMMALGVIYAGLMVMLPPGAFFSGDEGIKWLQVDSLWRHKWTSLAIDPPGGSLDPEGEFVPAFLVRAGGGVRSVFPALLPAIASVPYAVGGSRAIYLVPALATLLCLAAAARLAGFVLPPGPAALAGVATVAATPLAFYGATFWEHALGSALCAAAMIPLCARATAGAGLAAGLLLGLASLARTECLLMIAAALAGGWIAWGMKPFASRAAGVLCGAAVIVAPRLAYDRLTLGSWLPHLQANLPGGWLGRAARSPGAVAAELLGPAGWRASLAAVAALGLLLFVLAKAGSRASQSSLVASRWSRLLTAAGAILFVALLVAGPLRTLAMELSSQPLSTRERGYHSLLHTMPLIALVPWVALLPAVRRRPSSRDGTEDGTDDGEDDGATLRFLGWTAALFVGLVIATSPVDGGLQWGPRLLLPAVPLMTVALVAAIARRRQASGGRPAMTGLIAALALGLLMQGVGLRFVVAVRTYNARMLEQVRKTVPAGDVVLSDFFAVPQLLATLTPVTPVLYVRPDSDLEALSARLDAANVTPFWIVKHREGEGGHAVDLGGGLSLVRYEREAGVRGFLRAPRGD